MPSDSWREQSVAALYLRSEGQALVTRDALSAQLRARPTQPMSPVERWISPRQMVQFRWRRETWLPLFQFEPLALELRPAVVSALAELAGVFNDLELAEWFATPNAWLDGASPAKAISLRPAAVVDAARADRFIARG